MPAQIHRSLLPALLLAACGLAQAQAPAITPNAGTGARSASPTAPNMTPPPARPTAPDTQGTHPTATECQRLRAEQPELGSGGAMNADLKAKLDKCQQAVGANPR